MFWAKRTDIDSDISTTLVKQIDGITPVKEELDYTLPPVKKMVTDAQLKAMATVIDKHMWFEQKLQGRDMSPNQLCGEQKTSLVSDVLEIVR